MALVNFTLTIGAAALVAGCGGSLAPIGAQSATQMRGAARPGSPFTVCFTGQRPVARQLSGGAVNRRGRDAIRHGEVWRPAFDHTGKLYAEAPGYPVSNCSTGGPYSLVEFGPGQKTPEYIICSFSVVLGGMFAVAW
jgi:hypothetical protein